MRTDDDSSETTGTELTEANHHSRSDRRRLRADERGVSTTIGYVMTLVITAMLVSGLLFAGGQYVDDERRQVTHEELTVLADQLVAGLNDADRMSQLAPDPDVRVAVSLPDTVAGSSYLLEVDDLPGADVASHRLRLTGADGDVTVTRNLTTTRDVATRVVTGGELVVVYRDEDGDPDRELVLTTEDVSPSVAVPVTFADAEVGR